MDTTKTLPFKIEEHLQLSTIGIDTQDISAASLVTLGADDEAGDSSSKRRKLCIQTAQPGRNRSTCCSLIFVDTVTRDVVRRNFNAQLAIVNREGTIVALQDSDEIQIWNLKLNTKIKYLKIDGLSDRILFMKWMLAPDTLAFVTKEAVYRTLATNPSEDDDDFEVDFQRNKDATFQNFTIFNYVQDTSGTWSLLMGIRSERNCVIGQIQIVPKGSPCVYTMEGQAIAFFERDGAQFLAIAARTKKGDGNLTIQKLGEMMLEEKASCQIQFTDKVGMMSDFPAAIHHSPKFDALYVISKGGSFYLLSASNAKLHHVGCISSDPLFATNLHDVFGLLCLDRRGRVFSLHIDIETAENGDSENNNLDALLSILKRGQ